MTCSPDPAASPPSPYSPVIAALCPPVTDDSALFPVIPRHPGRGVICAALSSRLSSGAFVDALWILLGEQSLPLCMLCSPAVRVDLRRHACPPKTQQLFMMLRVWKLNTSVGPSVMLYRCALKRRRDFASCFAPLFKLTMLFVCIIRPLPINRPDRRLQTALKLPPRWTITQHLQFPGLHPIISIPLSNVVWTALLIHIPTLNFPGRCF